MPDAQMMSTLLMLALMVLAFYFLLIRPAQKKQKQQQTMVSQLAPGSRVMTTSGVYGTIVHLGERQAIIEIAPGVEMTILKQAIMRAVDAADDEFEYAEGEEYVEADAPAMDEEPLTTFDPADRAGYSEPTGYTDEPPTTERPRDAQ